MADRIFDVVEVDDEGRPGPGRRRVEPTMNLLKQDTVQMTVLAQDPEIGDKKGAFVTRIPVPADRLQRGPRSHRFHVINIDVASSTARAPVALHTEKAGPLDPKTGNKHAGLVSYPWAYDDDWAKKTTADAKALADNPKFIAQNVFAVASHTLALFEKHLGRRIPWASGHPHLYLVPDARLGTNANYSPPNNAVLFGWVPAFGKRPSVHSCLSFDVVAHEVTHAILDGLRPRYVEPGLPDQLAFHEALADIVALLSVFGLDGVALRLIGAEEDGRNRFLTTSRAKRAAKRLKPATPEEQREFLKDTALLGLAEELGRARARAGAVVDPRPGRMPLRRSVDLPRNAEWKNDPAFAEPHRRAEVLVAAFMDTLLTMWVGRLASLDPDRNGGINAMRIAEEGTKAADHLLGMVLRSLDYLPPVELEFADVIDSITTADRRLSPNDEHHYRDALIESFRAFGITAPKHRILDRDGQAAPNDEDETPQEDEKVATFEPDPDASPLGIRYEHLNYGAMHTSREEVYEFIWNNSATLGIDIRLSTKVDRVIGSTRVGPDGLIVTEILADYSQVLRTTAGKLPPGMTRPRGMKSSAVVEMWGGGVLVFDQFGRFRLHQRKLIGEIRRQDERLRHLFKADIRGKDGSYGATDGYRSDQRFALLHDDIESEDW